MRRGGALTRAEGHRVDEQAHARILTDDVVRTEEIRRGEDHLRDLRVGAERQSARRALDDLLGLQHGEHRRLRLRVRSEQGHDPILLVLIHLPIEGAEQAEEALLDLARRRRRQLTDPCRVVVIGVRG